MKIRGHRVSITEIEKVIVEHPGVEKVVVLCHTFSDVSSVIVGYYTTLSTNKSVHRRIEGELTNMCRKSLPQYMRPKLLHVDDVPLQIHTGKVDRAQLRKLYEKAFNRQSSLELSLLDEKCRKTMNIIALNLNLPTNAISRRKSFFELGGNSVSMVAVIVQLKEHGLHIPIEVFSRARTTQDIINNVVEGPSRPIGEMLKTDRYVVMSLTQVEHHHEIIEVLAESFVDKVCSFVDTFMKS